MLTSRQKSGLIVAISGFAAVTYTYGVIFGTSKSAVDRMALQRSLDYPEDSAGRRMQTDFVAVPPFCRFGEKLAAWVPEPPPTRRTSIDRSNGC